MRRDRRNGLTDADFAELSRQRDENLSRVIDAVCDQHGWDRTKVGVHVSGGHSDTCYCACPDGPCQHDWTGPLHDILDSEDRPCGSEVSCARCGMGAMSHDFRFMP